MLSHFTRFLGNAFTGNEDQNRHGTTLPSSLIPHLLQSPSESHYDESEEREDTAREVPNVQPLVYSFVDAFGDILEETAFENPRPAPQPPNVLEETAFENPRPAPQPPNNLEETAFENPRPAPQPPNALEKPSYERLPPILQPTNPLASPEQEGDFVCLPPIAPLIRQVDFFVNAGFSSDNNSLPPNDCEEGMSSPRSFITPSPEVAVSSDESSTEATEVDRGRSVVDPPSLPRKEVSPKTIVDAYGNHFISNRRFHSAPKKQPPRRHPRSSQIPPRFHQQSVHSYSTQQPGSEEAPSFTNPWDGSKIDSRETLDGVVYSNEKSWNRTDTVDLCCADGLSKVLCLEGSLENVIVNTEE